MCDGHNKPQGRLGQVCRLSDLLFWENRHNIIAQVTQQVGQVCNLSDRDNCDCVRCCLIFGYRDATNLTQRMEFVRSAAS